MIDNKLRLHHFHCHLHKNESAYCFFVSRPHLCRCRLDAQHEAVVARASGMVLEDEVECAEETAKADFVLVDSSDVSYFVWVDGFDLHVCGCAKRSGFAVYEPSGEGEYLLKCQGVNILKEFKIILEVGFLMFYTRNGTGLWVGVLHVACGQGTD